MFGTSGMRGPVGEDVTCELTLSIGRALATEGYEEVVVGRDARDSGRMLGDALSAGLRECGADVIRLGEVSTPTLARSVPRLDADAGVSVTASHNPPRDNGIKLWSASGRAFDPAQEGAIETHVEDDEPSLAAWNEVGTESNETGMVDRHVDAVVEATEDVDDCSVVVDVGNGTGRLTARALRRLGCSVETLNAHPDGRFPARPSEPTADHCNTLQEVVAETDADLGIAHDGDVDRAMAVAADGSFVSGDVLLAVFARATASPGDTVAAPINTSLAVADALDDRGADVAYTRVGDGFVAARAMAPDVVFGGEMSGAWIWPDETPCPDGPLAACRLATLVDDGGSLAALASEIPAYPTRRDSFAVSEKRAVMTQVSDLIEGPDENVDERDGLRVDTDDGWFLVRASGTQPLVRITAEARTTARSDELFERARDLVERADAAA